MPKAPDPIVIPPMTGIDDGKFTCIGKGLLYDGHARETPDGLRVLLTPGVGGQAITDRARPKAWWIAQALLYELPCSKSANITTIRTQVETGLRSNSLAVPTRLKQLENKSNREFNKLNKEVLEKTRGGAVAKPTATAKAPKTAKPTPAGPSKVTTTNKAGKSLLDRVETAPKPAAAPKPGPLKKPTADGGVKKAPKPNPVVNSAPAAEANPKKTAVKRSAGDAFKKEIDLSEILPKKKAKPPAKPKVKAENPAPPMISPPDVFIPKEEPAYYEDDYDMGPTYDDDDDDDDGYGQAGSSQAHSVPPPNDCVAGRWDITCPYIEGQWSEFTDYSLNIVRTHARQHIEANFRLGIVHGVIQSKTLEGRTDGGAYVTFEWVGKEENGPVLPPRREQTGWIRFSKDSGSGMPTLRGAFNGVDLCPGAVEFTGSWRGPPRRNEDRWDDYDERAYQRARVCRWGGSFAYDDEDDTYAQPL